MKKIILAVLLSIMGLVLANFAIGATTDTATTAASVTINTFVDITIAACPGGGAGSIGFGSKDPGDADVIPVDCNNASVGDVTVTVEAITNKAIDIDISGTNYTDGGSGVIAITQTEYDDNAALSTPTTFTETPTTTTAFSSVGGAGTTVDNQFYFRLDVPSSFLPAGAYTSTYTFDAS